MKFIAQKCSCCDDMTTGIEFHTNELQLTDDGYCFLAMDRDDVSTVYRSIDGFIGATSALGK